MGPAAASPAASREIGETESGVSHPAHLTAFQNPTTSIDVLDIREDQWPHKMFQESLNHDALVSRLERLDNYKGASLLVLFINTISISGKEHIVLASSKTLSFLGRHFGVSLLFLNSLGSMQWGPKSVNTSFDRRDNAEKVLQTDAYYSFDNEDRQCEIWYRNHPGTRRRTYIISNSSTKAKSQIMECANGKDCLQLLRPMMFDTFLAEAAWEGLKVNLQSLGKVLMTYENHGAAQVSGELMQYRLQRLYELSQKWHILREMLVDNDKALEFVSNIHNPFYCRAFPADQESNQEAIEFLQQSTKVWKRWVGNYITRTQNCINLYSNLTAQEDNKSVVEIANTSREIATVALRDSSFIMATVVMTMLVLTGTFISALLCMVFFNNGITASTKHTLTWSPQWWTFLTATIPLTVVVFGFWQIWQLTRVSQTSRADAEKPVAHLDEKAHVKHLRSLYAGDTETSDEHNPVGPGDGIARRMNSSRNWDPVARKSEAEASVAEALEGAP